MFISLSRQSSALSQAVWALCRFQVIVSLTKLDKSVRARWGGAETSHVHRCRDLLSGCHRSPSGSATALSSLKAAPSHKH